MLTWRDEGDRSIAKLGEWIVGEIIRRKKDEWNWFGFSMIDNHVGSRPTLEAARLALEAAVADWLARAGLVSINRAIKAEAEVSSLKKDMQAVQSDDGHD